MIICEDLTTLIRSHVHKTEPSCPTVAEIIKNSERLFLQAINIYDMLF
jgi:hypothetical protein